MDKQKSMTTQGELPDIGMFPKDLQDDITGGWTYTNRDLLIEQGLDGFTVYRKTEDSGAQLDIFVGLEEGHKRVLRMRYYPKYAAVFAFTVGPFGLYARQPVPPGTLKEVILLSQRAIEFWLKWQGLPDEVRKEVEAQADFVQQIFPSSQMPDSELMNFIYVRISRLQSLMSAWEYVLQSLSMVISLSLMIMLPWWPWIREAGFPRKLLYISPWLILAWMSVWGFAALVSRWRVAYKMSTIPWQVIGAILKAFGPHNTQRHQVDLN